MGIRMTIRLKASSTLIFPSVLDTFPQVGLTFPLSVHIFGTSMIKDPFQTMSDIHSRPQVPTEPGVYWFQSETMSKAMLMEVRLANGELTAWWLNQYFPVTKLNGRWRGHIPPSIGPDSH